MTRITTVTSASEFPSELLIDWDEFTVRNKLDTTTFDSIKNRELSAKAVNVLLMQEKYKMYSIDNIIGYNTDDSNKAHTYGMKESDAFSNWIIDVKTKEKSFKNAMPTTFSITQAQYDALVIFFVNTGQINRSISLDGSSYNVKEKILDKQWETVASMIMNDRNNFGLNRRAGTIMILGDYGQLQNRSWMRNQGIQTLRRQFQFLTDGYMIRQAEHSYYRETQKFLPGMSELRQREVATLYKTNKYTT
tara:strand:+ start:103 stop:846 length:744 start_codon:yes stop_codon:yes gene_type:complete